MATAKIFQALASDPRLRILAYLLDFHRNSICGGRLGRRIGARILMYHSYTAVLRAAAPTSHHAAASFGGSLLKASLTAGEIAERFDMSKPSLSKHLSILENAGLIRGEKKGQYIHHHNMGLNT